MTQWIGPAIETGEDDYVPVGVETPEVGSGVGSEIGLESTSAWDELWRSVLEGGSLLPPSPKVTELAERFWRAGARHVLDLGCGLGRHTVYLASRGYKVYATDVSSQALWACRRSLWTAGLEAETFQDPMIELSLPNKLVEWVLAENVIYHGRRSDMRQAIAEIARVLKPGGWLSATFLSTEDYKQQWYRKQAAVGCAEELEPGTFKALFRGPTDEHVPHNFLTRHELTADDLLEGFDEIEVTEERRDDTGEDGTRVYWHVVCRK